MLKIIEIAYSMNKNGKQRKFVKEKLVELIELNFNNVDSKISSETTRQTPISTANGDDIVRGLRKEEDNV